MLRAVKKLFKSNYLFTLGVIICLAWILAAVFAPLIAPYDPIANDLTARLQAPSAEHWFGTDYLGRDVFARIIYGGRVSLMVSLLAGTFAAAVGIGRAEGSDTDCTCKG